MGICSRVYLYDEHYGCYADKTKDDIIQDIKNIIPSAEVICNDGSLIIVDIDKANPCLLKGKVLCDFILFTDDYKMLPTLLEKHSSFDDPNYN